MASKTVAGKVNAISFLSKGEFKWVIDKFCMGCKNVGDFFESPKFTTHSHGSEIQCFLRLFPKGMDEDCEDCLSLFLYADPETKAAGSLKLLNSHGDEVVIKELPERVIDSEDGWGYPRFVSRDLIALDNILDKMIITCEITVSEYGENKRKSIKKATKRKFEEQEDNVASQLKVIDKYEALLNDSKFSDVSLISKGKAVKAHKCILAKSSTVFAAMFDAKMKERQKNTVEIADIEYDVLVEMVRFVYAGKVKNIDTLVGELAVAADKYALDELKDTCDKRMTKNLSVDNVVDCLQHAEKLRMDKLKEKAIEFIIEKGSDVTDKPEFELLPSDIICKICRGTIKRYK